MAKETLTERLCFSSKKDNETAIKLHNRNRDFGYYYDNLCLYCANNNIDMSDYDDEDCTISADIMKDHAVNDISVDHYYFYID